MLIMPNLTFEILMDILGLYNLQKIFTQINVIKY